MSRCDICGAQVPTDSLMVEHLAEHGVGSKENIMEEIANAPIVYVDENGVQRPFPEDD